MQNIVIAGFGFMGGMHAQVYGKLAGAKLVAIVDANRAAAEANIKKLGLNVPLYPDLDDALAKHAVDVIDVCLPTPFHVEYALRAVSAKKALFCEKPFARTPKEAADLASAIEKAKIKAQVGHCLRFWPEYQALTDFVRAKRGGRLLSMSLQRRSSPPAYTVGNWLANPKLSGGAAFDLHIHDTDFIHHLLGRPKAVTSIGTKDKSGWCHIYTNYRYPGVAVAAEAGWNYPSKWGFFMAFQCVFENAAIEYDSTANPTLTVTMKDEAKKPLAFAQPQAGESASGGGNISTLGGYFNELAYFIDCLENGRTPAIATPRQAADSVRTAAAEIRSLQTGRTVRL